MSKTTKELVEELKCVSFAEEIERDKSQIAKYIQRAEDAQSQLEEKKQEGNLTGDDNISSILQQEVASAAIYKRALVMLGSGDMMVNDDKGAVKAATDNGLPVSSYLTHGSRVVVTIPPGSGNSLINWLSTGDRNKNGLSYQQTQSGAIKEKKMVYNRPAATHDAVFVKGDDDKLEAKELKGFLIGARDFVKNKVFGQKTKHFGVDLALDADLNGLDSEGNQVKSPDGHHGHLYFHYTAPTKDKPGMLLIGSEGASPSSHKHSKTGASDPMSPTGGSKFYDLANKKEFANESEYKDTIIPKKYNGLSINLENNALENLVNQNLDDLGLNLAKAMPQKNPKEFIENAEDTNKLHQAVKSIASKQNLAEPVKPRYFGVKNFVSKVTLGVFFKKEVIEYKDAKKKYDIQTHLNINNNQREPIKDANVKKVRFSDSTIVIGAPSTTPIQTKKHNQGKAI